MSGRTDRDVLPETLSVSYQQDERVGPDGYIVIARRHPCGLEPLDAEKAPEWWGGLEWTVEHLERFHGWTSEEIAFEQEASPEGIGARHTCEHHPEDRGSFPEAWGRRRRDPLPIPHIHDSGPEVAIAYDTAMKGEFREALLALLKAAGSRWS